MDQRKRFQILVAEDSSADVALVREALNEADLDCALHVIGDGAEAIRFLDKLDAEQSASALDLVLLDMHLPKCDGEAILKRLRCTERYGQTPVIVMTASDSSVVEQKAMKFAALSYFRKPSSLDEFMKLGTIVRDLLDPPAKLDMHNTAPRDDEPDGGIE